MAFHLYRRWGQCLDEPSEEAMASALAELDEDDEEHPDTWLSHENGWSLSADQDGRLTWENADEDGEPRHLLDVSRAKVLALWRRLAEGDLEAIEREPWRPGYGHGPGLSPEELAERERQQAESIRIHDREFYDRLGPERESTRCRREGCERGTVALSVFCRRHEFENLQQRPCPFDD